LHAGGFSCILDPAYPPFTCKGIHAPKNQRRAHPQGNDRPAVGAGWYLRDHAEEQAKVKIEIPACPRALFGVDELLPVSREREVFAVENE